MFVAKRDVIKGEIEKAMEAIVRVGQEGSALDSGLGSSSSGPEGPVLRVGVFCAMGRHRSVAMVELLSRLPWPGWEVQVQHRDMMKRRGQTKNSGGKRR